MSDTTQSTSQNDDKSKQSKGNPVERDGVKFEEIERNQLKSVPVLSQAFDNQWFPQNLLQEALKVGEVSDDLELRRSEIVRAEYIRSLLNGEQVVINRAFCFNNPVIAQDYVPTESSDPNIAHNNREAFKKLLGEHVIIPYLYKERSPVEPQEMSTVAFEAWVKICKETENMQCGRLSWDDKENDKKAKLLLSDRFTSFVLTMALRDTERYTKVLGLKENDEQYLEKHLVTILQKGADLRATNGVINREDLYKLFVTFDNTKPATRHYDKNKPFAGEIKQLLDLAYNRNLPDALDGYLLIPVNSLTRAALQESLDDIKDSSSGGSLDGLKKILQRGVFDLVQSGLYLESLNVLTLADVLEIRKTDAWWTYITSLRNLLENPLSFAKGGARAVHKSYYLLAKQMTKQISKGYQQEMTAPTTFVVELVIEIAGGLITLVSSGDPKIAPLSTIAAPVFTEIGRKAVPFVVRYIIRDIANRRADKGLSNGIELMKGKITNAEEQWNDLLKYINKEITPLEGYIPADKPSTLTPPS